MEPDLKDLVRLLLRKSWFIGLMAALFCGGAYVQHNEYATPSYEAVTKLIVHASSSSAPVDTYKEIMSTTAILEPTVINHPELGLSVEELGGILQVSTSDKSEVISIHARHSSADTAAAIVTAVADTFRQQIPAIMKVDSVTILTDSFKAGSTRNISQSLNSKLMIAAMLSVIFSVGFILLLEYFDDKIRTEKDIAATIGKPVLAATARIRKADMKPGVKESRTAAKKSKAGETINVSVNQQA